MTKHTNLSGSAPRTMGAGLLLLSLLGASALSAQTAPAAARPAEEDTVVLSPFTVSTEKDVGYRATNSIAGTRTNTPIKDIPLNIHVFTKDLYDDLLITNQVDLERYNAALVNGGADVHSSNPIQQAYNQFLFRGFVQNWGLRDGIREYDPVDTQGLARVEVVKGPAAPLYGLAYPGGIMNNITKEADFSRNFTALRLTAQTEGEYRAAIDANYTSRSTPGGAFGLRFNGAYTQSNDHRAHSEGQIQYSQIAFTWQPLAGTRLKFLGEKGYREKPNGLSYFTTGETNSAGVALGNGASIPLQILHPQIPWEWNWSNGKNMRSLDTKLYRGTIEQSLGDNFTVSAFVQYSARQQIDGNGWDANGSGGADSWEAGGGWLDVGLPTERIEAGYSYRDWSNDMHAYGATGIYQFEVAKTKNTFAFGANVWAEKFVSRASNQGASANPIRLVYPIRANIDTTTVSFAPPTDFRPMTNGNGYTHEDNSNDYYFASWHLSALENRLKLNAAINRTNLKLVQWANAETAVPNLTQQSQNSPMFGVMYDITPEISVFAVHSTSLFPTTDKNSFGTQMPPVKGESNEGGFKVELLDGKISGTISYYQITQTGGSQNNPNAENLNTQRWDAMTAAQRAQAFPGRTRADLLGDLVPGAESESKGFEADLVFQPLRNWQVMFSYAHNDQEIVSALNPGIVGQSNPGHVGDQFSILTKYTFEEGPAKGLYVGAGFQAQGKALFDYQNNIARYHPRRYYAEAFGGYRFKYGEYSPVVQLNIKNLTRQEEYFGWQRTGSATTIASRPYEVPTKMRLSLTFGVDF